MQFRRARARMSSGRSAADGIEAFCPGDRAFNDRGLKLGLGSCRVQSTMLLCVMRDYWRYRMILLVTIGSAAIRAAVEASKEICGRAAIFVEELGDPFARRKPPEFALPFQACFAPTLPQN